MNNLLSIDQVAGLFDLVKHTSHTVVPLIEGLICSLLNSLCTLLEDNEPLQAIDLSRYTALLNHHIAKFAFSLIHWHAHEVGKTR